MWAHLEATLEITSVHARALEAIAAGERQVSTVAAACGRHVSSASRLVDTLVARSLVTRVEDPDDRRAALLELTPAGEQVLEQIRDQHLTLIAAALDGLPPDERARVVHALECFADAVERAADGSLEVGAR